MFVDVDGGEVRVKIALLGATAGEAAALVRAVAARTTRSCFGKLVEGASDTERLIRFDYYLPKLRLESGEIGHPHLCAIDPADASPDDSDWRALFAGADAVVRVGSSDAALEAEARFAGGAPAYDADAASLDAAIERAVEGAMALAREAGAVEGAYDAVAFAEVTCPWCHELVEITVEADVEGEYVQDCEVCCHPWAVMVTRDDDGSLRADIQRG